MTWIIQFNKLKYKPNLVICMPLKNSYITPSATHYYWGKDLSGSFQGAGGVGGLLYLTIDGSTFVPLYDNNGNITHYLDSNGNVVAQYTYDAFGNTIAQSSLLANTFRHRYSTKYLDTETGLYYYGYRFYHPTLMRWLNRDPIEEAGGLNLYAFCENSIIGVDVLGHIGMLSGNIIVDSKGKTLGLTGEFAAREVLRLLNFLNNLHDTMGRK